MIELTDVAVVREGRAILAVERLTLPTKGLTVLLGHNGSGKSTLASVLSGLSKPDTGRVTFEGRDWFALNEKARAKSLAFLPQKLPSTAGLTCRELVRLGRFPWRGLFARWTAADHDAVEKALAATDTLKFADEDADRLSGGERQRVWIAMLLAQSAPVLLLDEPTSALDVKHQYGVLELLAELCRKENKGVIVVLHDLNLALRYAQHVVALKGGRVLFDGPASLLTDEARLYSLYDTPVRVFEHPFAGPEHPGLKAALVCPGSQA